MLASAAYALQWGGGSAYREWWASGKIAFTSNGHVIRSETPQEKRKREQIERYNRLVGEYNEKYGQKSGWAGVVQTATRIFHSALNNPLGALVGLVVGLGVLAAAVGTGGTFLGVLAAAGGAAFSWGLGVGLVDELLFGGAGGRAVEVTLGDYGTSILMAGHYSLATAGAVAGGINFLFPPVWRMWGVGLEKGSRPLSNYWFGSNPMSYSKFQARMRWGISPKFNSMENMTFGRVWRWHRHRQVSSSSRDGIYPGGAPEYYIPDPGKVIAPVFNIPVAWPRLY